MDYVLGRFSSEELKRIEPCINQAVEAIRSFATAGLQRTMNQYNTIEKNETSHNQNPNADTL